MKINDFLAQELNRRRFLGTSALNAAGMAAGMVGISSGALGSGTAAHDRLRLGVIGARSQGKELALSAVRTGEACITALCDIDPRVSHKAAVSIQEAQGWRPGCVNDFRTLLESPQVDAVIIATPDHWHAAMVMDAVRAEKDVYVETPVSHSIAEGQQMLEAVRGSGRVVQCGLQQRSGAHFQSAVALVRSGRLGRVRMARAWSAIRRTSLGAQPDAAPPAGIAYDHWLGPAPQRPFNANRFHQHWNRFWDYGSGELGVWGVHLLDIARWGLEVELPVRVSATGGLLYLTGDQETPDTLDVYYEYPRSVIHWEHRQWTTHGSDSRHVGLAFFGDQGTLVIDRSGWKVYDCREKLTADASELKESHLRNFFEAIRSRRSPAADIETGYISSTLCHLGNIAYRLGRDISVDPEHPNLVTNSEALALVRGTHHTPLDWPTA